MHQARLEKEMQTSSFGLNQVLVGLEWSILRISLMSWSSNRTQPPHNSILWRSRNNRTLSSTTVPQISRTALVVSLAIRSTEAKIKISSRVSLVNKEKSYHQMSDKGSKLNNEINSSFQTRNQSQRKTTIMKTWLNQRSLVTRPNFCTDLAMQVILFMVLTRLKDTSQRRSKVISRQLLWDSQTTTSSRKEREIGVIMLVIEIQAMGQSEASNPQEATTKVWWPPWTQIKICEIRMWVQTWTTWTNSVHLTTSRQVHTMLLHLLAKVSNAGTMTKISTTTALMVLTNIMTTEEMLKVLRITLILYQSLVR